jgi:hypothetical protein
MKTINEHIAKATVDLMQSNEVTEKAKDKYDATLDKKKKLDEHLNSYMSRK